MIVDIDPGYYWKKKKNVGGGGGVVFIERRRRGSTQYGGIVGQSMVSTDYRLVYSWHISSDLKATCR